MIDVRSISITGAFNAIKAFFQSQENNSKWKDTETGAEGNFLMRMLANVIRVISQNTITGRREVFQDTANLLSSQIGIGVTTGSYPTYRGRNQRRLINFTPNDNMTIPMLTRIGAYNDYGIYTVNDLTFVKDQPQEFSVVIGNLREVTWSANTSGIRKFVRFEQNISEDVDLLIDGTSLTKEGALSKYVKDMIYDKYCILTNPWKSVTIQYLNNAANAKYKYSADTQFTLRYIELEDMDSIDFTTTMFTEYGKLNNVLTIENYVPFETVEDIKANAPVYRETQSKVRSKVDFADLVRDFVPSISKTNYEPLTPTYTAVTYLKKDNSLIEDHEYAQLAKDLEPCMAFGRPLPDIVDPLREVTTLDVTVGATNRYNDEASITADIQNIADAKYTNILEGTFDKYDLEQEINKLAYTKYSRVYVHVEDRAPYTQKQIGDYITANNLTYKCTGILGETGINEPDWNIPSDDNSVEQIYTGLETEDNTIVWACYKRLNVKGIQSWKASKKFKLGEIVYSDSIPQYMFKAVDIIRATGVSAPDVTGVEVGDYVYDGTMVLLCITYNNTYPDRVNNTKYRLGTKFNYSGLSFEYVGMTGYTSSDETLTFNDAEYQLLPLTGNDYDRAYKLDGQTCLYVDDTEVAKMVNPGDILRVNLVEEVDKEWEEVSANNLTMNSKLVTKVKKYKDKETDSSGGTDTPIIEPETTVTVITNFTANVAPDVSQVQMGETITDGDFQLTRIPYDETYPERISAYSYNNNDKINVTTYNEEGEITLSYSFTVVAPVTKTQTDTTYTEVTTLADNTEEEKPVQNANWKELEKYLALQDEVQEWIASEGADKLRCPSDVIQFFAEIGRISSEEKTLLTSYYNQYDEYDEHQIYMYMDSMNATRMEAIQMMTKKDDEHKHCYQLKAPIADAKCVKQYNSDSKLVYVDQYSDEFTITTTDTTGEEVKYTAFTVTRTDSDLVKRAVRTYIYKDEHTVVLYDETINKDSEKVSRVYLVTAKEAKVVARDLNGKVKDLTRITPTTAIAKYTEGYVNISFKKTDDGDIRWEQVTNTDIVEYDWNVHSDYKINLTVKY